jgi:YHS domain-containing protein
MRFLFRIFAFLVILLLVRSLIRSIFSGMRSAGLANRAPEQPPVPAGGELIKDPVCGTYVSPAASLSATVEGKKLYFCSKECRDKYPAR